MDRELTKKYNSLKALYELGFIDPKATAKNINYIGIVSKFFCCSLLLIYVSNNFFIAINHLIYIIQNLLKCFLFIYTQITQYSGIVIEPYLPCDDTRKLYDESSLPLYSILIPMYKEGVGVKSIISNISKLNYPTKLLDVKLVLEEDDVETLSILESIDLEEHMNIIKVPYSQPRTKPKAINYAMQYIKGEYVVIYDVEDMPETEQLMKAVRSFKSLPEEVICLQAKLRFYNHDKNILAKLFNIEYQIWFDFLLPAMDRFNIPVPLGGNSNHFKAGALRKLGLWDAYNVTEDADLGIRLFMHGFKAKIIDSYSFEEAPTDIKNWLNQRSRWIKGFMQTFLVYSCQTNKLKSKMSLKSRICTYIFIGFTTYSFLFLPWYFIITQSENFINSILSQINIYMTFLYMYYSGAIIVSSTNFLYKVKLLDIVALILWPFYFILHTIAGYKALFELITQPFSWNKTRHSISES